jgi:pimeloyl-ACP methyl ester carboxylesterase
MKAIFYQLVYFYFLWKRYRKLYQEYKFQPRPIKIASQKIYFYDSHTKGKPILCIHGFLDSAVGFRKLAEHLKGSFQIFLVDVPSFGKSKLPDNKYLFQIDLFARMIYDALQILDLKNLTLVGHSMGGLIAQHIALIDQKKGLIDSLVLLASANAPHPKRDEMRKILFPQNKLEFQNLFENLYSLEKPEFSDFVLNTLVYVWNSKKYLYLAENTITREKEIFIGNKIKKLKIPTLIISGKEDIFTTQEDMRRILKWTQKGELILIENAKHVIHLEYPEKISKEIINFLSKYEL